MIKILYLAKEENPEQKCSNCEHYSYCNYSLQIEKLENYFDTKNCKQYRYTPPTRQFQSDDEELSDKIVALIEEFEAKKPVL